MPRGQRITIGKTSKPHHRVLRLGNFHFAADDAQVREFFDGFDVVDWTRDTNVKSKKDSIAYVLMSSLQELFRAIEELDGNELNGRCVRVMRANSGFTLTKDGLLNNPGAQSRTDNEKENEPEPASEEWSYVGPAKKKKKAILASEVSSSAPADPPWFTLTRPSPSYSPSQTYTLNEQSEADVPPPTETIFKLPDVQISRRPPIARPHAQTEQFENEAPAPAENVFSLPDIHTARRPPIAPPSMPSTPPRRTLTDPRHQVLLVTNLHTEADVNSVKLFFNGYTVVDFIARRSARTMKALGFGFVMLGSQEQRDRALQNMQGKPLMGKIVELEVVSKAIRVNQNGFVEGGVGDSPTPTRSGRRGVEYRVRKDSTPSRRNSASSRAAQRMEGNGLSALSILAAAAEHMESVRETSPAAPPTNAIPTTTAPSEYAELIREAFPNAPTGAMPTTAAGTEHMGPTRDTLPTAAATNAPNDNRHNLPTTAPAASVTKPVRNSWYGHRFPAFGQTLPTWDSKLAHRFLRPWNLAGNDSEDRMWNMVTEEDWYYLQKKEIVRYR